ncbi:armadillo-type protein [Catenaria anguillulae PL171]|uniref:Armadillo-type protein n=1 Tax=Catenaria anguillulae PL171 TaxID=765915 RepID=A0A1Y2HT49_9FUNG|nr:armadillo-type protein [Catenaria anguillulae PL171]
MVLTSCSMKAFRLWTIFTSQMLLSSKLLRTGMISMTAAIVAGQLMLLAIWGGISPQQPTRNVPSTFSESTWNFNAAQVIAVASPLVGCLALFDFGSATLIAIVVKQVTILLTTAFVFGALIGRIAIVTYTVHSRSGMAPGSKVAAPAGNAARRDGSRGTPDPGQRGSGKSASPAQGQNASSTPAGTDASGFKLRGVYLVCTLGSLRAKWVHQEVWLSFEDGLLGILPTNNASVTTVSQEPASSSRHLLTKSTAAGIMGRVLRLSTMRYNPDPANQSNCLEVITNGAGYLIHFPSTEEWSDWVKCLSKAGAVVQNSQRPSSAQPVYPQLIAALQVMYNDHSSADQRRQAQQYLIQLQKAPEAWDLGWLCLQQGSDLQVQFFGAQTLHIKVSRDFELLPSEQYQPIREQLMEGVLSACHPAMPPVVMRRMCFALVAFALRTAPEHWSDMIPDLLSHFQSRCAALAASFPNTPDQILLLQGLLEVLRVLPEEFLSAMLTTQHKHKLQLHLTDSLPVVLTSLHDLLIHPSTHICTLALESLTAWVQFGIPIAQLGTVLSQTMALAQSDETSDAALKLLTEVVSHSSSARFEETFVQLAPGLHEAIANEDESHVEMVGRFVTALVENFPGWFVQHMDRPEVVQVLMPMLVAMVAFPGYPGAQQAISEMPMHSFFLIQETVCNPDQLPLSALSPTTTNANGAVNGSAGDMAMSTNSSTDSLVLLDRGPAGADVDSPAASLPPRLLAACEQVFLALFEQLVAKCEWPPTDAMWASWTKDRRDRWGAWRRDCKDNLLVCYYVLRAKAVDWLLVQIPQANSWHRLETLLFAVRSLGEALNASASTDTQVTGLLGMVLAPHVLSPPQPHPLRVRQTLLYVVGEYATWFHAHQQHVPFAVQILLGGLRDTTTLGSASKLLRDFCDVCRGELAASLGSIVEVYVEVKNVLPVLEKQRVVEAISMVIQRLPQSEMIAPLTVMLEETLSELTKCLDLPPSPDVRDHLLRQLAMLQAFCKGLQASDMEAEVIVLDATATEDLPQFVNLRTHLIQLMTRIHATYGTSDIETLNAVCSLMSVCIASTTPPMVFAPTSWLPLVGNMVQSPSILLSPTVMDVIGDLFHHARPLPDGLFQVLAATVRGMIDTLSANNAAASREQPEMVDAFLTLCGAVLRANPARCIKRVDSGGTRVFRKLFDSQGARINEGGGALLVSIHCASGGARVIAQLDVVNEAVFPGLVAVLVRSLLNDAPRIIVPNYAEILFRVVSHMPNQSRMWLNELLVGPNAVPSAHPLSLEDRKALMRLVMGTRQLKRFKDHVKDYHAKACGLEGARF